MLYNINRDKDKDPTGMRWVDLYPEWKSRVKEAKKNPAQLKEFWENNVVPSVNARPEGQG